MWRVLGRQAKRWREIIMQLDRLAPFITPLSSGSRSFTTWRRAFSHVFLSASTMLTFQPPPQHLQPPFRTDLGKCEEFIPMTTFTTGATTHRPIIRPKHAFRAAQPFHHGMPTASNAAFQHCTSFRLHPTSSVDATD